MFDLEIFYEQLLASNHFGDYWDNFPRVRLMRFKEKTLALLKDNINAEDENGLSATLAIIYHDGADKDYTDILLYLLEEKRHALQEDIVLILELIKDPKSIDKLYKLALDVPEHDEMRALAKKCMWALSAINTDEAKQKLILLQKSNDPIIEENATFQLKSYFDQD